MAVFLFMRRMVEVSAIKTGNNDLISQLAGSHPGGRTDEEIRALSTKDIEIYEIAGPFFFGVADMLQNTLRNVAKPPRVLILRMRDVPVVDSTGITALESFVTQCKARKTVTILTELREQPGKALRKSGFFDDIDDKLIATNLDDAVETALSMVKEAAAT
jgi:SulP family sulfate permease